MRVDCELPEKSEQLGLSSSHRSQLVPSSKLAKAAESVGLALRIPEEKEWEKERSLADGLTVAAIKERVSLPVPVATRLVKLVGPDRALLKQELLKLICFVGERGIKR